LRIIGLNPANFRGSDEDDLRAFLPEELSNRIGVLKIQLRTGAREDRLIASARELPDQRCSNESAMARDENFR
jgi:hypothetical protein